MAAAAVRRDGPEGEQPLPSSVDVAALHASAEALVRLHGGSAAVPAGSSFRQHLLEHARTGAQRSTLAQLGGDIERRARAGRVRSIGAGAPVDILFDLAGTLADLIARGRGTDANILANRYLDLSPQGATGWALLPLMLSLRTGDPAAADRLLEEVPPQLIVIGGLSGTGKSSLSRLLGAHYGRRPGARVLRSDVFRKRLAGVAPEARLPATQYTRRNDALTYEALFESADDHLRCGSTVIVDAVFLNRSEREVAQALAVQVRAPFSGIWLEAPDRDRIARITARTADASDATAEIAREQARRSVGDLFGWHRMRANRAMEQILPAARAAIERARR
ncbi:AAA family ATPase [Sphingomonas sp. TDK1]|uniref:AAA family ATPase n=1 Tax=Sphingomonas sp. TDK1 TaxID=453247 RepID=UPI0007D952BB|nr:bifunctional aminoglycoside phosphotransferase/ATP-binding protein [Sphingomonas sp. TDK1]OAN57334.1 aminoglycoside phosphotransferase [Sphingomonas sp. TDK1]